MIVLSEKVHDGYKAAIVNFLDFIQNSYFWNGLNRKSLSIYLRKSIRHQHSCNLLSNRRMVRKLNNPLVQGSLSRFRGILDGVSRNKRSYS